MTYLHDKNFHFVNIKIKYIKENIEKATKKKRPINEKIKICNQQIVINSLQQPLFYETSFFISLIILKIQTFTVTQSNCSWFYSLFLKHYSLYNLLSCETLHCRLLCVRFHLSTSLFVSLIDLIIEHSLQIWMVVCAPSKQSQCSIVRDSFSSVQSQSILLQCLKRLQREKRATSI